MLVNLSLTFVVVGPQSLQTLFRGRSCLASKARASVCFVGLVVTCRMTESPFCSFAPKQEALLTANKT